MENRPEFLCPICEYGHFFRVVKDAKGIPYDTQYTCGSIKGPKGPGGWDGKTCPNFKRSPPRDPLEGCEITFTKGPVVTFKYSR
jgi:hypothetical protein